MRFKTSIKTSYSYLLSSILLLYLFLQPSASKLSQNNICDQLIAAQKSKQTDLVQNILEQLKNQRYVPCVIELVPKYFWAQNMSHIMVKLQFLNSADTSACDQVLSITKDINHTQFSVTLVCLQSSRVIRYRLRVRTFMPMNHYHSLWKTSQQNTIILECLKSPSPYFWKQLYLQNHTPARLPKIWWKIMQKNSQNIGNFIYELELGDDESDISSYVRGRKQVRKSRYSRSYIPQSRKYLYCNGNNVFELGSWL